MKDKNILSYHKMMNQCPFYKGKELLKMYLTWNNHETTEIIRSSLKFGKTIPSQNKHPTLNEVDFLPKRVAPNPRCGETHVMPPPRPIHIKKTCIVSNDDDFLLTPHKNKGKQPRVTKLSISRSNSCVQHVPKEKAKIPNQIKIITPFFGS
jgi:hypothetical protein